MARLIKVGIIGCGGIANGKHLPSLKKVADCEMVAFCDIVLERAEKAAKEYGVPDAKVFADYRELLKEADIGTHALDLTLWMMNNYKPKYCVGTSYTSAKTGEIYRF